PTPRAFSTIPGIRARANSWRKFSAIDRPAMPTPNIRSAAELPLEARTGGQPLETLPAALMPATIEEAYAIQDRVTAALGPIGGWKTAPANNGVYFNWAPIPATGIFPDAAEIALSAFPRSALELEI